MQKAIFEGLVYDIDDNPLQVAYVGEEAFYISSSFIREVATFGGSVEGMVPADGVYAGWLVLLDGPSVPGEDTARRLPAAVSVGTNPTFDGVQRRVEAYVLDRDDLDLYGRRVAVDFVDLLRPMVRFDGIGALIAQMHADVARSRVVLGVTGPDDAPAA